MANNASMVFQIYGSCKISAETLLYISQF